MHAIGLHNSQFQIPDSQVYTPWLENVSKHGVRETKECQLTHLASEERAWDLWNSCKFHIERERVTFGDQINNYVDSRCSWMHRNARKCCWMSLKWSGWSVWRIFQCDLEHARAPEKEGLEWRKIQRVSARRARRGESNLVYKQLRRWRGIQQGHWLRGDSGPLPNGRAAVRCHVRCKVCEPSNHVDTPTLT